MSLDSYKVDLGNERDINTDLMFLGAPQPTVSGSSTVQLIISGDDKLLTFKAIYFRWISRKTDYQKQNVDSQVDTHNNVSYETYPDISDTNLKCISECFKYVKNFLIIKNDVNSY